MGLIEAYVTEQIGLEILSDNLNTEEGLVVTWRAENIYNCTVDIQGVDFEAE